MLNKNNYIIPRIFIKFFLILSLFMQPGYAGNIFEFSKKIKSQDHKGVVYEGNIGLEIITEELAIIPGENLHLGLKIIHDPEWHTYWVNPGDSGLATSIKWSFPQSNSLWEIENIQWPTPKKIIVGPLANFGFENEILLIQKITAPKNLKIGESLKIDAVVSWLACKDVCIPGEKRLTLEIPVVQKMKIREFSKDSIKFVDARKMQPTKEYYSNPIRASVSVNNQNLVFFQDTENEIENSKTFKPIKGFFFPFQEGLIKSTQEQTFYNFKKDSKSRTFSGEGNWLLEIELAEPSKDLIQKLFLDKKIEGIFVDENGNGKFWSAEFVESTFLPQKGDSINFVKKTKPTDNFSVLTIVNAVFFAFLGGLILNLMPCVFPVVGLKVLSLTKGVKNKSFLIKNGISFALGVVLSVMSFAVFFVIFRELGYSVGWGIQLQSPWAVLSLSMLFIVIAMNLAGVYEFGNSLTVMSKYDKGKGLTGAFFSGVLTVVVASPCTAPFMGGAIGFAATANLYVVFLIFFSLAIGICAPYFILILQPGLLQKLPSPGEWMVKLRQFLAFPMIAASGWLFWVLIELNGSSALFPGWLAILFVCLTLWIWGKFFQPSTVSARSRLIFLPMLILSSLFCIFFFYSSVSSVKTNNISNQLTSKKMTEKIIDHQNKAINWIPWKENLVDKFVEEGYIVFIDFTASWCVICQTNKLRVLDTAPIIQRLSQPGIIAIRADWTNADEKITQALIKYGRIGIPLNVVLGPSLTEPIILSEWLTKNEVLDAIKKAKNYSYQ